MLWRKTWDIRKDGLERSRMFINRLPRPVRGHGREWQHFSLQTHKVPFTDHARNPALMVFQNPAQIMYATLPPLFLIVLYLTHPNAAPSPSQAEALVALYNIINSSYLGSDFVFPLDVYFLAGGSEADCKAHYLRERASRLDVHTAMMLYRRLEFRYSHQEDKLRRGQPIRRNLSRLRPPVGHLPGMQHEFPDLEPYKAFLLISADGDWREGEQQRIECVKFDLVGSSAEDRKRVAARYMDLSDDEDDARSLPAETENEEELDHLDNGFDEDGQEGESEGDENLEADGEEEVEELEDTEINQEKEEEEEAAAIDHPDSITQSVRILAYNPRTHGASNDQILGGWVRNAISSIQELPGYHLDIAQIRAAEMGWSNW